MTLSYAFTNTDFTASIRKLVSSGALCIVAPTHPLGAAPSWYYTFSQRAFPNVLSV